MVRAITTGEGAAGSSVAEEVPCHFRVVQKIFMASVGEPVELYFFIYNATVKKELTEAYYVKLTANGMPENIDQIDKIGTIFSNLYSKDTSQRVSLKLTL